MPKFSSNSVSPVHRDISTVLIVSIAHPRKVILSCPRACRRCHSECVKADSRGVRWCPHWQIVVRRAEDLAAKNCSYCVIDSIPVNFASKQKEKCRWQCSSIPVDLSLEKELSSKNYLRWLWLVPPPRQSYNSFFFQDIQLWDLKEWIGSGIVMTTQSSTRTEKAAGIHEFGPSQWE